MKTLAALFAVYLTLVAAAVHGQLGERPPPFRCGTSHDLPEGPPVVREYSLVESPQGVPVEIGVLFLYTSRVTGVTSRVREWVRTANELFDAGTSGVRLTVAGIRRAPASVSALDNGNPCNGLLEEASSEDWRLSSLREEYGGDVVTVVSSYDPDVATCSGVAWLWSNQYSPVQFKPRAYNVVGMQDGLSSYFQKVEEKSFAHEIGHNLGLHHDRDTIESADEVSFSEWKDRLHDRAGFGYVNPNETGLTYGGVPAFAGTVMAYGDVHLAGFSRPYGDLPILGLAELDRERIEMDAGDSTTNADRALRATAASVAAFYEEESSSLPPAAPTDLTGEASSTTRIRLTWVDRSSNEDGFVVHYRRYGESEWRPLDTIHPANTTRTEVSWNSPPTTKRWQFRIRVFNAYGEAFSNTATVTLPDSDDDPDPSLPAAPTNLTGEALSTTRIRLTWVDRSSNEDGFVVHYRRYGESEWRPLDTIHPANTTGTEVSWNSPPTTKRWQFRIRVFNAYGEAFSNTATVTLPDSDDDPDPSLPAAPTNLTGEALSTTRIRLTWVDRSSNEDGFVVHYRRYGESEWRPLDTIHPANTTGTEVSWNSPPTTKRWQFRIRVFNAYGEAFSNTATVTLPDSDDDPPDPSGRCPDTSGEERDCHKTAAGHTFALRFFHRGEWKWAEIAVRSGDSAVFHFFGENNLEVFAKVLDGCAINGTIWVYASGLTDLPIHMVVLRSGGGDSEGFSIPDGLVLRPNNGGVLDWCE